MPDYARIILMLQNQSTGAGRLLRGSVRKPEPLEPRCLLTVPPIEFGAVYTEQDFGSDGSPDTIEISFTGGAPGTQMSRLEVDTDKMPNGLSLADILFDTQPSGLGADLSFSAQVTARSGDSREQVQVEDGSSKIVLLLDDFVAGDKLTLSVDVDEMQGFVEEATSVPALNEEIDPIASGAEFQGSLLTALFQAPHFHDSQGEAEFRNHYDENLLGTQLDLPRDGEGGKRDRTAGAFGRVSQKPLPVEISGRVYEDHNGNLQQESIDPGIASVEVDLFVLDEDGYVFTGHTAVTDTAGDYIFDASLDLLPGTYQVRETQPQGYFSIGATVGTIDSQPVGSISSEDVLTEIAIAKGGQSAVEYNFAEAIPASLRGRIQLSTPDGDCFSDGIEHDPVVGARVQLVAASGQLIAESASDAEGRYEFRGLRPGEYTIVEITPEHLIDGGVRVGEVDGEQRGTPGEDRISQLRLLSGDEGIKYDFCEHVPAEVRGSVYHDRNNDGIPGLGEEGIEGALLSLLDETGELVEAAATDANGQYEFVGVRAGNYRIIQLQPDGWLDGTDRAGTVGGRAMGRAVNPGDAIDEIELQWGDVGVDFDFGELKPSSLAGRVHLSTPDGDCFEVDEGLLEPVAGAVVRLLDATGRVLAEARTDQDGRYSFNQLAPGQYSVQELTPAGLRDGGAHAGTVDGEPRGEVLNAGEIVDIRLDSDESGLDYDFCEHRPAVLSGYVYSDADNDGLRTAGETPIAGVTVQLWDDRENLIAEVQTDTNGRYEFTDLAPGRYRVREIQPAAWVDGLDAAGTVSGLPNGIAENPGDLLRGITLRWSDVGEDFNFGELRPASLRGFVHAAGVEDCWNVEDAEPIDGVRMGLLDGSGSIVAETLTDARGRYTFTDLPPGEYTVSQQQPLTHFQGSQRAGSGGGDDSLDNLISAISISAGQQLVDYAFCELLPSSISGFVFQDGAPIPLDADEELPVVLAGLRVGQRTSDDTPIAGVTIELRNGITGDPIDGEVALPGTYPSGPIRTVTDTAGHYTFEGLPKGNYAVYQLHPESFLDGIDTPGTTSGIAINPLPPDEDDIFIETVVSTLSEPPRNDAIVRIGLPAATQSQHNNFSEVLTSRRRPPFPIEPPPPTPFAPPVEPEFPGLYARAAALTPEPLSELTFPAEGSASARANTWHLSIIDGGYPRAAGQEGSSVFLPASMWRADQLNQARWRIPAGVEADSRYHTFFFGSANGIPVSGDFNGDGASEIGVFTEGHWFIDLNANGYWDSHDLWAKLGDRDDLPVTGDWDGDGKDDIGIFGRARPRDSQAVAHEPGLPDLDNVPSGEKKNLPPSADKASLERRIMKLTAQGRLQADVIDHVFLYGTSGDRPVSGDWNGDGIDTPGVYREGRWRLDVDGNGRLSPPDREVHFGRAGDVPLVGDFNGDGIDDLAIFRGDIIYIDANGNCRLDSNDLAVRRPSDEQGLPVAGKWSGEARDGIAWYEPSESEEELVLARRPRE